MDGIKYIVEFFSEFFKNFFGETLHNIGVKDVIDILLLSFVLFFIYNLIRDSRAWKLIIGLTVMLLMSVIAEIFDMSALGFILGNFQQLGLIAIIVLFQPEFRTALERVGGTPLTGIKSIAASSEAMANMSADIDSICTAVGDLSRDKLGALIVIERSTKLGDFIQSGVEIDSVVSPFVIKNIFFNKAPLHDGAVIVRNNRIAAAGCFLPLSTKEDIDKDLGTRHRAAIGLTEVSDAVVVVVSEETGKISLAVGGTLERNYNYTTLKQTLNSLLVPQVAENVKNRISKSQKKKDD